MSEQSNTRRFEELMLPHLDAAHNLARWLMQGDSDAEDVVQEAYLRAYRFFHGFHGEKARAWLLAIVRNTAFTMMQARGATVPLDVEHAPNDSQISGDAENPEAILARSDERRLVNEALRKLPVEYREVIVLREIEELSYREIAQVTSAPIGTVMSRLSRARKLLAEHFAAGTKEPNHGL